MLQLGQGRDINVISDVTEERRRNSPRALSLELSFFIVLNVLVADSLCGISVDNFVETGENVPTCQPLEHPTSLHEETSLGDFAGHLGPVSEPDVEARVARFPVDGDEV